MKDYPRKETVIRILLSAPLVVGVFIETGFFTALVVFLFFVRAELQDWTFHLKGW